MASPAKRRATYEDLLQVADHKVAEIVDGDLYASPRPASRHALDWVCEVVSPSTERLDRAKKVAVYARAVVAHLRLVNPLSRTLEVYRRAENGWLLLATHEGSGPVRAEPFEAVELELGPLFGE